MTELRKVTATVDNFPAIQVVSGTVDVGNFPALWSVTGTILAQQDGPWSVGVNNWPAVQTVSVNNFPAVQTVDGTVTVGNWPLTFPATQSGAWTVDVGNFPAVQAVSGSVAATQSGPWTVDVGNFPAVQAVSQSGTWNVTGSFTLPTGAATETKQDAQIVLLGPVNETPPASDTATSGINGRLQRIAQNISTLITSLLSVRLGWSTGKTIVGLYGTTTTTTTTPDQVILTYTVPAGQTLYVQGWTVSVKRTNFSATATEYGHAGVESPAGTKLNWYNMAHAGTQHPGPSQLYPEPMPIPAGTVIRFVTTPNVTTSCDWHANLWGYLA